jgi:hypothetical protein
MLGAMEDETAALFYLLALYSQLRVNPQEKTGPYYLPALFLVMGSLCKITWLGLIPALLFMDWVNYPKSRFAQRITRYLPFLVFIPTLFLNFLFIGFSNLGGSFLPNFNEHFIARNLIPGSFYSFIPVDIFLKNFYQIAVVVPILFFVLAVLFTREKSRTFAIVIAYIGTLGILGLAQISKNPVGWMMGWRHLTPLVGFAAMIMAVSIVGIIDKLRMGYAGWIVAIVLLLSLIWSGFPMKRTLKEDILNEGIIYRKVTNSFNILCQSFPKQTEIYVLGKKPGSVNLLADLAGYDYKLVMLYSERNGLNLVHNYDARSKHYILLDTDEVISLLDQIVPNSNARFIIQNREGIWIDITGSGKDELGMVLTHSH